MSYNGSVWLLKMASEMGMAQWEIHKRFGFTQSMWWRWMPGVIAEVKWPRGWVVLHEAEDGSKVSTESADPNDHYRPWLEKNIGKQGRDWDWKLGQVPTDNTAQDTLLIKVRHKHADALMIFKLKYT